MSLIEEMVLQASNIFTRIISTMEIKENYPKLYWGGNGVGDRFANKKFNYSVIFSKKPPEVYSENENDKIPNQLLDEFLQNHKGIGIIGIYVHSKRINNLPNRPIKESIAKEITSYSCVSCGTSKTICDHKNDLYNDNRVLNINTQQLSDFQPLCNHCNLQKRQVCIKEKQEKKLYSAKNIKKYQQEEFEFPWEKKIFDESDIFCKNDTYWFDPVEFHRKISIYSKYVNPIVNAIKHKVKLVS